MAWKRMIRPSNRKVRLMVGLLLAGLVCIQCSRSEAVRPSTKLVSVVEGKTVGQNAAEVSSDIDHWARTDHLALLEYCLKNCSGRYQDYTCTFIKQERIRDSLGAEQWINVKFMSTPYSVAMKWIKNPPAGDHVLYVEGQYGNQMLVLPTGFLGSVVGAVLRAPDGPDAMQSTLRPVNLFGFERGLKSLIEVYAKAKDAGDLKEEFDGYKDVAGRKAITLVRYLPAKTGYPAMKTVTYIDSEYLVPIGIEGYDWNNRLTSRYIYKDVKFNVGLAQKDFSPEANGMKAPK